jgi:hypothetical protein
LLLAAVAAQIGMAAMTGYLADPEAEVVAEVIKKAAADLEHKKVNRAIAEDLDLEILAVMEHLYILEILVVVEAAVQELLVKMLGELGVGIMHKAKAEKGEQAELVR